MHPRSARSRFVTRFLAYFEHSRRARERARRLRLEVSPFESREAPSDAIQSLHPIGLLADIGIDPLAIVPPVAEPPVAAPPTPVAAPQMNPPLAKADALSPPPLPGTASSATAPPLAIEPPRTGSPDVDFSLDDALAFAVPPSRPGSTASPDGGTGGGAAPVLDRPAPTQEPGGGDTRAPEATPPDYGDAPGNDQPASPPTAAPAAVAQDNGTTTETTSNAPNGTSLTYVSSGSNTPQDGGVGGAIFDLPGRPGNSSLPSANPTSAPTGSTPFAGSSPVSLTPSGTPATPVSPTGFTLPGGIPEPNSGSASGTPNSSPPPTGFNQGSTPGQPQLPQNLPGGVEISNGTGALPAGQQPAGSGPGPALGEAPAPVGGLTPKGGGGGGGGGEIGVRGVPPATPGLTRTGNYTITVTQTGSNTTDGFTLIETAVVDYQLHVSPSSHYDWDATATFDYLFTRGTTTLSGVGTMFTSHVAGDGTHVIVDGGVWGGVADENDANPFSLGFYNYNFGHFSITGDWTTYTWDETGHGYNNLIYAANEPSSTVSAGFTTDSGFSVWASAYNSNAFTYHLAGTHLSGQVGVATYSLFATGDDLTSSAATGSVVTAPTTGVVGDSVSASYDYESSGDGHYTVSQWGTSATANYSTYDHGTVSSSLHTQASATLRSVSGTATITGAAAYVADDSRAGTVTEVGAGAYDFGTRTGNDTVSASASASAAFDSSLTVTYADAGTGSYTAKELAGYGYTATAQGSDSYSAIGSGSSLTATVTAQSVTYTTSASGTNTSNLTATFTGTTTGTESSTWGLSLTNAYAFSDQVSGREIGVTAIDASAANAFSETGDYSYSLSVTSTATNASAASTGGTDGSTVTRSAYFQTSSSYSLSGTGHESQWVTGSSTLSSADSTATLNGNGTDNDRQIAIGRFTHSNATAPAENSSATFSYSATSSDTYSYHADATAIQTPTTFTRTETYTENGTNTVNSALSLSYSLQGAGTYVRGNSGVYTHGTSLTGGDSASVGPGGSVALSADHEWVTYSSTANGTDTVSGSGTFVADPTVRLEQWGYQFTDAYQFADTATGTSIDQTQTGAESSTETGNYSYSLSISSTTSVTDGNTGTDRTTVFADGTDGYTTTETASFSLAGSASLSSTTSTATYAGGGVDRETTIQSGETTHTSTTADPTDWTTSYSYTGSDTASYTYAGNSNDLSNGATSTYYAADSVTETTDANYSWRKGGRTVGYQQTDSFTMIESGDAHSRDQLLPTYTQSGTATGQYTPYSGTAWDSAGYMYSLTITPAVTASPTSVTADYWDQGVETNTATYSGNVARGTFGNTQSHHDQETNWHSGTYTTNERGTPAPDAPPGSGGTTSGSTSSSSTSSSSPSPSTYTLTAHGTGQLLTVRTDDELWFGATSATMASSSMTVVMTGDGNDSSTLTETYSAAQNWSVPLANAGPGPTINGTVSGTRSRTVTNGNSYTLSAAQTYLVTGSAIASGSDTFSLHASEFASDHDAYTGTASVTGMPVLFNGTGDGTIAVGNYTTTVVQTEDDNSGVDRVVTAGYSWTAGHFTGANVDARTHLGTIAPTQTLSLVNTGVVTVLGGTATYARSPAMATEITANRETVTGTQVVSTSYTASVTGYGTYQPIVHTTSARESWGTGTVTLHSDGYKPISLGPSHTQTLAATADHWVSDSHSAYWTWDQGVGGSAGSTGTETATNDYQFSYVNREVTGSGTASSTMVSVGHDDTATNVRRTYTVPAGLSTSTGAANQDQVAATYLAVGFNTSSVTSTATNTGGGGNGFSWHHDYASETFTAATTESLTLTNTSRWVVGQDDHQGSMSNTYSVGLTMSAMQDQQTSTHTFTMARAEHYSLPISTTQDAINYQDYQSASVSHSETVHSDLQDIWSTSVGLYTASLTEYGPGADVTSTLATSESLNMQAHGSSYESSVEAWFNASVDSTDTNQSIKTPAGGGATRTLSTTAHVSSGALNALYLPDRGIPKFTYSTVYANHLMTVQQVGTFTESLTGVLTDTMHFASHKLNRDYFKIMHTTGSLVSGTLVTNSWYDRNDDTFNDLHDMGIDPAWLIFAGNFVEAFLDVIVGAVQGLIHLATHPDEALNFILNLPEHILKLPEQIRQWATSIGNVIFALVTGVDPTTGRELSKEEYAALAGGMLGTIAGMVVLQYAGRAVGQVVGRVGGYIGAVIKGERCSWKPWKACFAAGTPLRTPDGSKLIEKFQVGDLLLSRDENRPQGPVEAKSVEEVFVANGRILHVHVPGQVIRTTPEHPFHAYNKGWVPAKVLVAGDLLQGEGGEWVPVDEVLDTGEDQRVYNLRVADWHTYFVGADRWGFSVWAHNTCDGLHHYVPRFLGSLVARGSAVLTFFRQIGHIQIHRALNSYLKPLGMAPSRANPGWMIIDKFSRTERIKALMRFYKQYQGGAHYQAFMTELRQTIRLGLFQ